MCSLFSATALRQDFDVGIITVPLIGLLETVAIAQAFGRFLCGAFLQCCLLPCSDTQFAQWSHYSEPVTMSTSCTCTQPVPDGPQGQMFTRTRGSENGQRVYSVWLAFLWKAGGRKKRVRMRAWEGVLAGRPYACALTTVSMTFSPPKYTPYENKSTR